MNTRSDMAGPLVEVRDLGFAYRHGEGWLQVLHDVNLTIYRGEVLGLVGESGCGKSTVAHMLLGFRGRGGRVCGGKVLFDGEDVLAMSRLQLDRVRGNRISFVPQNPTTALSPHMRVGRQIAEVLLRHGVASGPEDALANAAALFEQVGLPDPENIGRRYPHQLSGGQQQRAIIAMALACKPDLVVLDEPTTGLDVTTQAQIIELLHELRGRHRVAMLYVTHDLGVLSQIADRVGVMYAGHMVESAATADLFDQPRHPYTRGLIASIPQLAANGRTGGQPLRGLLRRDALPAGCPFQPRCDFAEADCATNHQHLEPVTASHVVACQRWRQLDAPAIVATGAGAAPEQPATAVQPVLTVDGVSLRYGGGRGLLARLGARPPETVVDDVTFTIERGEIFALVGESGSGKSTIARAISGLLSPFAGGIGFEDRPLPGLVGERSGDLRRRIQYVFQNPDASLNPRAKIGTILARPLEMFFDLDRTAVRDGVARILHDVRLDGSYAARYPDQLSGGERQRIAIARALVADPVLLLCDEVLSALDVSVQASILDLLQRLKRGTDVSMLFISHDLAVVRSLADRVGVLYQGRLLECGTVGEVFEPPFHPYTRSLLMAVPGLGVERRTYAGQRDTAGAGSNAAGCVFAGRCPSQLGEKCEREPPPWHDAGGSLRIRCHLPLAELAGRAEWRIGEDAIIASTNASAIE